MSIPVSLLVTSGRFRDNRRGQLKVTVDAVDLAFITITQPGDDRQQLAPTTTELVLSGAHLEALRDALAQACELAAGSRTRLHAVPQLLDQDLAS